MKNNASDAQKLWELIKNIEIAMLTTQDGDGSLHSRPMATQQREFDGHLWFFTAAASHKVREVISLDRKNIRKSPLTKKNAHAYRKTVLRETDS